MADPRRRGDAPVRALGVEHDTRDDPRQHPADPESIGLDAAFAALFLGLAAPYVRGRRAVAASILAAAITLVLLPLAPAGLPFVAAAAACLLGLRQ